MHKYHLELTSNEKDLLSKIKLTRHTSHSDGHAIYLENKKHIPGLMASLVYRGAITEHRQRYWLDPACHTGRIKTSHKGLFERNGCSGQDIYIHPHFVPFLRYFLFGAELPDDVIEAFERQAGRPDWFSSGDIQPLCKVARDFARGHALGQEAAEEFFKLSLEVGLGIDVAGAVREAVKRLR